MYEATYLCELIRTDELRLRGIKRGISDSFLDTNSARSCVKKKKQRKFRNAPFAVMMIGKLDVAQNQGPIVAGQFLSTGNPKHECKKTVRL
jgi:hypothetical protein